MKHYVLVHGAFGRASEFDKVISQLAVEGNAVTAIDLPGHGDNPAPISEVTMQAYIDEVVQTINGIDKKVILVGHSLAGAVISQVAEIIPEKIDRLVYVAAALLKAGDTVLNLMESDEGGQLLPALIFSDDQTFATINADIVRTIFLHDINDPAQIEKSIPDFLIKQSTQPFMAPVKVSKEVFGKVPKYYIRTTQDRVMSLPAQNRMITNWMVNQIFTLESGHFPLVSNADQLARTISAASISDPAHEDAA